MTTQCEARIERFIAGLTIALGIGMLIARPGHGLYAVLEASGVRIQWSVAMNSIGLGLFLMSFSRAYLIRLLLAVASMVFWGMLAFRMIDGRLWGATIQASVVILFCNSVGWSLWRAHRDGM